jgi:hypothetical protein
LPESLFHKKGDVQPIRGLARFMNLTERHHVIQRDAALGTGIRDARNIDRR